MKESREKRAFGGGYIYADSTASGTDTHGLRNACKKGGIENKVSVFNKQSRKPDNTILLELSLRLEGVSKEHGNLAEDGLHPPSLHVLYHAGVVILVELGNVLLHQVNLSQRSVQLNEIERDKRIHAVLPLTTTPFHLNLVIGLDVTKRLKTYDGSEFSLNTSVKQNVLTTHDRLDSAQRLCVVLSK